MKEGKSRSIGPRAGRRSTVRACILGVIGVVAAAAVSAGTAATLAETASADVDVSITLPPLTAKPVAGVPISLNLGIGNAGPDGTSARLLVDLPQGLEATLANRLGCSTGTGTIDCGRQDLPTAESMDDVFKVLATQSGTFTVVVRAVELTATDPNPANNTTSLEVTVGRAATRPAVAGFRLSPARPRAGSPLTASFAVVDLATGKRIVSSKASCAASAGGAKVRGVGLVRAGRATCKFLPPKQSKGKRLRGTVSATVAGKKLKKAFEVLLR